MTPTEQDKELDYILAKHNGELGVTWEDPDVVTPDTKQAILNWHNKQIEEVLDRLESQSRRADECTDDTYVVKMIRVEAERNELKESKR